MLHLSVLHGITMTLKKNLKCGSQAQNVLGAWKWQTVTSLPQATDGPSAPTWYEGTHHSDVEPVLLPITSARPRAWRELALRTAGSAGSS